MIWAKLPWIVLEGGSKGMCGMIGVK